MDTPHLPNRYAILSFLGQGGEGRVFRVHDSLRGSDLALKVAPLSLAVWLRHEFDTLRQVKHENLVRVFDWGISESEIFYTMELVVGTDWAARMGAAQRPGDVAGIVVGLLRGLAHLHSHGEVHGDLKPGNVLLSRDGLTKLTDIGMGGAAKGSTMSGTPGYAAPELWEGSRADIRADIYSVGVMAYEALTGHHPFAGRTIREVVSGQLEGWVPSPAVHGVHLPGEMERTVMRALERDAALRPGTADEFMEMLDEVDRVGNILGGRFVARRDELAAVDAMFASNDPQSPTLLWIDGESGVGKSAFVEELSNRATFSGRRLVRALTPADIGIFNVLLTPTFAESEQVWEITQPSPTVFILDVPDDDDAESTMRSVRTLARHLHAISSERGIGCGALVVCETHRQVASQEQFEGEVRLSPLTETETDELLRGYLGTVTVQPEVVTWLCSATGGVPERLTSVINELIGRRLLRRSSGQWAFKESHDLPSIVGSLREGKWHQSWERLDQLEQGAVALLANMPQGLGRTILAHLLDSSEARTEALIEKGWIRLVEDRLRLSSGERRSIALKASSSQRGSAIERRLLDLESNSLTREERAWLLIRNRATTEALDEGLWSARQARERGDLRAAVERARACLDIAKVLSDELAVESAGFILAQALHLLGRNDEAVLQLASKEGNRSAAREQLLGVIKRSQGDLADAKAHLTKAIAMAERDRDSAAFLQSHAELAEVDWRHGDERARDAAIRRVKEALVREAAAQGSINDRAALIYQLGSALIVTGKRDEARTVLEEGLALTPDDYWTMRITTALAAAEYYLGQFDKALELIDEAWRRAERGGFDLFKARIFSNRAGIHYGLGKFREAVEYHRLSAVWARRSGQEFEYLAAISNEAVNLMLLGEYESALNRTKEAQTISGEIGNEFQSMKNLETEALCEMLIGDYTKALELGDRMLRKSEHFGYSDMTPRALLLKGMLAQIACDWGEARSQLVEAESMLLRSRDWEDLPAVQIELQWIRAQDEPRAAAEGVARIVDEVSRSGALTVQLRGSFILGEILLAGQIDDTEYRNPLLGALGRASQAGACEDEWRLNYVLGELCLRGGDRKAAMSRFAQALRGFRSIAERLCTEHRVHYLRTPHANRLLKRVA
jgi:serine/threonine protein kinase/tetratricopeptide (TPR) repeat protein